MEYVRFVIYRWRGVCGRWPDGDIRIGRGWLFRLVADWRGLVALTARCGILAVWVLMVAIRHGFGLTTSMLYWGLRVSRRAKGRIRVPRTVPMFLPLPMCLGRIGRMRWFAL